MTKLTAPLFLVLITVMNSPAYANFQKATSLLKKVEAGLRGLSVTTVTIATIFCGYKILFGGCTVREMAPTIIGGIVIAMAAEVARMLV